ncbi:hypothetical protein BGW38_005599, partial [Lunasporangiospora selenospora]
MTNAAPAWTGSSFGLSLSSFLDDSTFQKWIGQSEPRFCPRSPRASTRPVLPTRAQTFTGVRRQFPVEVKVNGVAVDNEQWMTRTQSPEQMPPTLPPPTPRSAALASGGNGGVSGGMEDSCVDPSSEFSGMNGCKDNGHDYDQEETSPASMDAKTRATMRDMPISKSPIGRTESKPPP